MTLTDAQHAMTRTVLRLHLLLFVLTAFFFNSRPAQAIGYARIATPRLTGSYESARESAPRLLRRVYAKDVLDLPVVQQPASNPYYVSDRKGEVTQFAMVSQYGNLGLLAHNTLAGKHFFQLAVGQEIRLTYENGRSEYFVVTEILRFQAFQPESVSSSFRDVEGSETLSAVEMFNRIYVGGSRLVFQTCIEAKGDPSWGRLFVIAVPKK
ncbi:MAG TPA: hypothetical protein VK900_20585 [Anaerolineales bacterium]|nr:hypothetical protein [Anaerolineales bacterium]